MDRKRTDYIEWDEYFMATAILAAKRSKDPVTQVGACIVNKDKRIVGVGYNGMPNECSDDEFPWRKPFKNLYVCHAEMNAIVNKNSSDVKDCTIYVTLFPCNECAKLIIQSGIKEVIYLSHKNAGEKTEASKKMFDAENVNIKCRQYKPKNSKLEIDFIEKSQSPTSPTEETITETTSKKKRKNSET